MKAANSLEELARELESPAQRELMNRASVLRHFNQFIFRKYIRLNLSHKRGPKVFEEFISNLNIERLAQSGKAYAVKASARQSYFQDLLTERSRQSRDWKKYETFFSGVAGYYQRKGPAFARDRLAVLLICDPATAAIELEKLYAEADQRFDLTSCSDLLQLCETRTVFLTEELTNLYQAKRQYYDARCYFSADHYQTNTYLGRASLSDEFKQIMFTPESGKWIFHIYATGGLGKTMFVRWLISRHCVPEPARIPVARLDFDMLNLSNLSRYPLLILLAIAAQLNQQIEKLPFTELFSSRANFMYLLDSTNLPAGMRLPDVEADFRRHEPLWSPTAVGEFCRALHESKFSRPIVIAIDTVEEMLLLNKDSLVQVIRLIEGIHREYPGLRLVLSGRYDLREELTDLRDLFVNETYPYQLKRFNTTEAHEYVSSKRRLKDDAIKDALVKKCTDEEQLINPFILSLLTDLVITKDIETVEDIEKFERAEIAYMIQRIIERIKDQDVRWMLRYAVIPRFLTLEFVENVMWRHIEAERKGRDQDKRNVGFNQREFWHDDDGKASAPKTAWERLRPFVSKYGWVSRDQDDFSRLRLHAEVVMPMRLLLAKEQVFRLLHQDASQFFIRQAAARTHEWAVLMSEAVYHRFQWLGAKAASFWQQQLNDSRAQSDMTVRRVLAVEITTRDYIDAKDVPLKWTDGTTEADIVTIESLCQAHAESAVASMMLATKQELNSEDYAKEWNTTRHHLLKLKALLERRDAANYEPSFEVDDYLQIAEELNKSLINHAVAIPLMEKALESTRAAFLALALRIQLAEIYSNDNSEKAGEHFEQALKHSIFLKVPFFPSRQIHLRLARWYQNQKHLTKALEEYQAVLNTSRRPETIRTIKYRLAEVNREIGLFGPAEVLSSEIYKESKQSEVSAEKKFDCALLYADIQSRDLYRPLIGLRVAESLLESANGDKRQLAAATELKGCSLGQLLEFAEAPAALEQARVLWTAVSHPIGPDRARLRRVEFQLNEMGNINEAVILIDQWATESEKKNLELAGQMELLHVRGLFMLGLRQQALIKWRTFLEREDVEASPRILTRMLSGGLAVGLGDETTLTRLVKALERVDPPTSRLQLLDAFRFADTNDHPIGSEYEKIIKLLEWPADKREATLSACIFADVLRFCGAKDLLKTVLERAFILAEHESFSRFQVMSACRRARVLLESADPYDSGFVDDYQQYGGLCYAALLLRADAELERDELEKCDQTLALARENYAAPEITTKWTARAALLAGRLATKLDSPERALSHFRAASSIYQRLGNKLFAERVEYQTSDRRAGDAIGSARRAAVLYSIRMSLDENQIVIASQRPGADPQKRHLPRGSFSDELSATFRDRYELFNLTNRLAADLPGFSRALGEIILSPEDAEFFSGLRGKKRPDARIEVPPSLAKIPWELATTDSGARLLKFFRHFYRTTSSERAQSELMKWIQFAGKALTMASLVVDGVYGPATANVLTSLGMVAGNLALSEIQENLVDQLRETSATKRCRVLAIYPSFETQVALQRVSALSEAARREIYEGRVSAYEAIEVHGSDRSADEVLQSVTDFQPELIHIVSSFVENPSTAQVYMDFAQRTSTRSFEGKTESSVQFSTTLLNDALFRFSGSKLRPLVIVEAQTVPGVSGSIQQLFLRNTFASDLFRLGNTNGVIATGLFSSAGEHELITPLIKILSQGGTLGESVNAMREASDATAEDNSLSPLESPVLFTDNPLFAFLPLD